MHKTYEVFVTREGNRWLADVPSVPGAHTYADSMDGLRRAVREVTILMDGLPDDAEPHLTLHERSTQGR